jgi:hypothetical protein
MRKVGLIIGLLLIFITCSYSFAQKPQGITVVPSIAHIDLANDQPEYELTYINNTKNNINLLLSVQDFTVLEDSYKINFLQGKDALNYKYSLSSWISFENNNLQLNPNEKKSVKIFIDKNRITKGGHYASILAEITQEDQKNKINVRGILSSLLFVRASTGQEIEEAKILSLRPFTTGIEYPSSFSLRFENSGNVFVVPYGLIQVYDPLGNLAAKGIFNEDSLDALPESIRTYNTPITVYQKVLLPGIYTAKINLHFGKSNQKLSFTIKFFSQGMFDFAKIAVGLIILGILILYYKRKKRKNLS